jgi:heterotetrameric sarcosine oxidase gamma subunit
MLEPQSAIAAALAAGGCDGADGRRRLRLGERHGWHLVQASHYAGAAPRFEAAVQGVIGQPLPSSASTAMHAGGDLVLRTAPDQYWIFTANATRAAALAAAVPVDAGAVLVLSGSRTCIVIDGASAREVLMKLLPIDLHPTAFPVGGFVQSGIHHVGGLLHRAAADRYEFYALRTYAATTWEAIADAARSHGYDTFIEGEPA